MTWDEPRWAPGEGDVRCRRCADAGWLRLDDPAPWLRKPQDLLVPCPCRHATTEPGEQR